MKLIFVVLYIYFVICLIKEVKNLVSKHKTQEAIIGLFMTFVIVPDFIILDAFKISGTFIIVFFFMCLLPLLYIIFNKHPLKIGKKDILIVFFLLAIFVYALYTKFIINSTTHYWGTKLFNFIYALILPICILISYKKKVINSFDEWKFVLLYAILAYSFKNFSLVGVLNFRDLYLQNYDELKNVIFASQILAIGSLICMYDLIRNYNLKTTILLLILIFQMILFESRGVILGFLCATIVFWWFSGKKILPKKIRSKALIGVGLFSLAFIVGFSYLWNTGYLDRLVDKLNDFASGEKSETRYVLYPTVIEAIKNNFPFGTGFGNTKTALTSLNYYLKLDYPHNIMLEIILEEGLLIAIIFLILTLKWLTSIFVKDRYNCHTLLYYSLFIFALVGSMFSGDIAGNYNLFIFGFLAYNSKNLYKLKQLKSFHG